MFANVHRSQNEPAFTADDFLGTGNREERRRRASRDALELFKSNQQLAKIQPGAKPEDLVDIVPEWALNLGRKQKEKHG